jgi:hypothetical protein
MSKTVKERELKYGGKIPPDYLPAHNHIAHVPEYRHGQHGFRNFFIPPEWVEEGRWKECPCGWGEMDRGARPFGWGIRLFGCKHYAAADHVDRWNERINKHGSVKAAQGAMRKELQKAGVLPTFKNGKLHWAREAHQRRPHNGG